MIKTIPPRSYAAFDDLNQVTHVKVGHDGLRGRDFATFVKTASHPLALWVRDNPPKTGEVYVHSHIFSFTDTGGANRNGDEYSRKMARADLPTYEKFGRAYRNHQNRDASKAMGVVKKAYCNEEMGRAELIVALNATKEAAERNGGVTADRTLDKMASDHDVAVSQSCRVPYDVCTGCGNHAKTRADYCTQMTCKYGGCRDNLGRVFDDGHHLAVDNPRCDFFDWSDVSDTRGADRTAFITGKVASSGRVVGGAELAELMNLVPPDHLIDPATRAGIAVLKKLASTRRPSQSVCDWATTVSIRTKSAPGTELPDFTGPDFERHTKLANLAAGGVVLPPDIWLSAVTGVDAEKCASAFAGGIDPNRDLLSRDDCHDLLGAYAFTVQPSVRHGLAPSAKSFGLETQAAALGATKRASGAAAPTVCAESKARYLAYQTAVLRIHENSPNFDLLLTECARHNSI